MSIETDQFVIDRVQWKYLESRETTGDRIGLQPVRDGVLSAFITCKKCASSWYATVGNMPGQLLTTIGYMVVTCQCCPIEEKIPLRTLQ